MRTEIKEGMTFGKWTVIDAVPIYTKGGQRNVKVQCECGAVEYKHWSSLRLGKTKQCLKCARLSRRVEAEVGKTYKGWIVISGAENVKGQLRYKCRCSCGNERYMTSTALMNTTRWFKCKQCATQESIDGMTIRNGRVGDLTLSKVNSIQAKAVLRKIDFNLSIEYLWSLYVAQGKRCAITGDELPSIRKASLDRIDSKVGYVEGNVQWVTSQANKCKHILSMSELYEFARKVLNNANQQPSQPLTKLEGSETNP